MIVESLFIATVLLMILLLTSLVMMSANEYIISTEEFFVKNKRDFMKYLNITLKILTKNIINKKSDSIDLLTFASYLFSLSLIITPVVFVLKMNYRNDITSDPHMMDHFINYYPIYVVIIVYVNRMISYIALASRLDINKIMSKGYLSLALLILNYSFAFAVVENGNVQLQTFNKFIIFLNTVFATYLFDHYTKFKKSEKIYQKKFLDKMLLVIMLVGLFMFLNKSEQFILKLPYYFVSIILIDFISIYIKKNVGHFKIEQLQKINFQIVFLYYVLINTGVFMVNYVI